MPCVMLQFFSWGSSAVCTIDRYETNQGQPTQTWLSLSVPVRYWSNDGDGEFDAGWQVEFYFYCHDLIIVQM